jgi:transposase
MATSKKAMLRLAHESDPHVLRQAALILERENQKLVAKVTELTRKLLERDGADADQLRIELARLEEQLALRTKKIFGESSEKRGTVHSKEDAESNELQRGHGPRAQPELLVVEEKHELDAADCTCPDCGGELAAWDGQFEESEEIDVVERQFVMRKHRRTKYRCACGHIETALAPEKLFDGARYSIDFAVEVAIGKYLDHLPLERQVRIMKREGLAIESQTLWDQIERVARVLAPAYDRVVAHVLSHAVIGADETWWRLMGKKDDAKRWQVWTIAAPDAVAYRLEDSRSAKAASKLLGDYSGVTMCDGYSAYESLAKKGGAFTLAHCWAHVRRKFVEAEEFFPKECGEVLAMIAELYEVESRCATGPPGDAMRTQLRDERSRPLVKRIHDWTLGVRALRESTLAKAITYMGGVWKGLLRFLDDPRIPIDNNATERAIRGVVVGRKNHYGSRSERGTQVAALFYSLIETAKLVGVEPKAYLRGAIRDGLRGDVIALPHQIAARA